MTTEHHHHTPDDVHEHDLGLQHDVDTLHRRGLGRRGLLGVLGGLGAAGALAACSSDTSSATSTGPAGGAPAAGGTGAAGENYLRGVQEADEEGWLSFTTIFPGCCAGRWPHGHVEVYGSVETPTSASNKLRTSQLAFPQDVCEEVYTTAGDEGYVATLEVPIRATA